MHLGTAKLLQFYIIVVFNTVINKCNFIDVHEKEIPSSKIYKHLGEFTLLECILRARNFKEIDKTWAFKKHTNSKSVGYCYIIDPNLFDADNNDVIKMVVDSKLLSTETIKPTTIPTESSSISTKSSAITTMVTQDGFTTNSLTTIVTVDQQNTTKNTATPDQQNTTTNATIPYPNNNTENINATVNNISSTEPVSSSLVSTTEIIVSTTESPVLTTESSVSTTESIILPLCREVCISQDSCIGYENVEYVDYPCECFYGDDCLTKNGRRIKNIALDGHATQLGEPFYWEGKPHTADLAIDGILSLGQHTKYHDRPWWKVVLQRVAIVYEVSLYRRNDYQERYGNMHVLIGNTSINNQLTCSNNAFPRDVFNSRIACMMTGNYVKLESELDNNVLNVNEVKVYGYYLNSEIIT